MRLTAGAPDNHAGGASVTVRQLTLAGHTYDFASLGAPLVKATPDAADTPFSASSTAADVLDSLDLTGKEVIVTGGHGRLGREVTRALVAAGAAVTVAARDPQRAAAAVAGIAGLRVEQLDLTDPGSVEVFAQRWLVSGRPLHVLINNAGVLPPPPELHRQTPDWPAESRNVAPLDLPRRSTRR